MPPIMQSVFSPSASFNKLPQVKKKNKKNNVYHRCPALCLSDGICDWDQAEWRSGGLGRSGSLLLPWGGPGGHRGVPAGALAGGPACAHACVASNHHGATNAHTLPPEHQDHRLVWGWQFRKKDDNGMMWPLAYFCIVYLTVSFACVSIENSWSGQHPYEWHCGSHTSNEEYEDQALPPAWSSPHDNQWVSSRTSISL